MGCSTVLLASAAGGGTKAHREIHNARRTVKLGGRGGAVAAATCNVDILAVASSPSTSCSSLSRSVAPTGSSSSTPASALHKLVCRVRSGWRRQAAALCAGGSSGSRPRFGYDFESYCRNFDDGCCRDYN